MNKLHQERDDATARAHDAIRSALELVPVDWSPGDVFLVTPDGACIINAGAVAVVVAQLAGPAAVLALERLEVDPGEARVLVIDGPRVGLTTIAMRQMQAGGDA